MNIKLNTRTIKILGLESPFKNLDFIFSILQQEKDWNILDDFSHYELVFNKIEAKVDILNTLQQEQHHDIIIIDCAVSNHIKDFICNKIRNNYKDRHIGLIFVCTNNKAYELALEYLEKGADEYFKHDASVKEIQARFKAVLRLKLTTDKLRRANYYLKELSRTDDLTGLYNMRAFNTYYSHVLRECKNSKTSFAIMMLDLDNFKLVNDVINHLMGSYIIKQVGKLIKNSGILSPNDIPARYGGDEYIILTYDDNVELAQEKALKLKKLINNTLFTKDNKAVQISTSVGLCWIPAGFIGNDEEPIKSADMMLYKSKNSGRNRLHVMQAIPQFKQAVPDSFNDKYVFIEIPITTNNYDDSNIDGTPRFFST